MPIYELHKHCSLYSFLPFFFLSLYLIKLIIQESDSSQKQFHEVPYVNNEKLIAMIYYVSYTLLLVVVLK
jgi:hypothetical protein